MVVVLTSIGCTVVTLWFFALLLWSDRRHERVMEDRERQRHEREAERRDRQLLLQRIQVPEQAANDFTATQPAQPQVQQHIPFDDDAAYWQMRAGLEDSLIGVDPLAEGPE